MCIGSNSVNQAQDLMTVTKMKDLPNSLLPNKRSPICPSVYTQIIVWEHTRRGTVHIHVWLI